MESKKTDFKIKDFNQIFYKKLSSKEITIYLKNLGKTTGKTFPGSIK